MLRKMEDRDVTRNVALVSMLNCVCLLPISILGNSKFHKIGCFDIVQ